MGHLAAGGAAARRIVRPERGPSYRSARRTESQVETHPWTGGVNVAVTRESAPVQREDSA